MSDVIDLESPEIKAAIDAQAAIQAKALAQSSIDEKLADYVPKADVEGLVSKKDELLGKLQEYKGVSLEDIQGFKKLQQKAESDETMRLIAEGKTEEAVARLTAKQREAWDGQYKTLEEQLKASQTNSQELESKLEEMHGRNTSLQKRQYFKDLVSGDDSFKSEYFGDFYDLYNGKADIDAATGAVYAVENGNRVVDHNGDLVKFEDFYTKQKVNHGLFWNGGSGSGVKQGQGGSGSMDISSMTAAEKTELRKEIGDTAYADLLRKKK